MQEPYADHGSRPGHHRHRSHRHHDRRRDEFGDPFLNDPFFSDPFSGRSRSSPAFSDPFALFDSIFGDMRRHFNDPFFNDAFGEHFPQVGGPFGRSAFGRSPFGGGSLFDRVMNDPSFGMLPPTTGMFPSLEAPRHGQTFHSSSAGVFTRGPDGSGQWVTQSKMTRSVNGVTESVWKRTDSSVSI